MIRYYIKKLINNLVSLFIFLTMVFFIIQIVMPYDFTVQFAMGMNREARARYAEELGLNLPLYRQYLNWLGQIIRGDLGESFYGTGIAGILQAELPMTLLVFVTGAVIAFLLGQWLGKVTAWRGPGPLTGTTTFLVVALYTIFPPWLGFLLGFLLIEKLQLLPRRNPQGLFAGLVKSFPPGFNYSPAQIMTRMVLGLGVVFVLVLALNFLVKRLARRNVPSIVQFVLVSGGWVGSWFLFGIGLTAWEVVKLAGISILAFILLSLGETMLVMQTSMRDTLTEEYVRTARAKGFSERRVRDRHAAPNAILPVFSRMVVSLPYLLTGIVIIEYATGWPGMGSRLYFALYQQDIPVVMAILLLVGLVSMVSRLVLEFLELYLDPRLRDEVASVPGQ